MWWNFSLSTKLILLVVVPLALTSAVTLPLTMTELNKLASVTNLDLLEDEILLVKTHFDAFEKEIDEEATALSHNPAVVEAVRKSDDAEIKIVLFSSRARMGFQYLQVVDRYGARLGFDDQSGVVSDRKLINQTESVGLSQVDVTKLFRSDDRWYLTSIRQIHDREEYLGFVAVGRLIDFEALAEMNFGRDDPVLAFLDEQGQVVSSSDSSGEGNSHLSITTDPDSVLAAQSGQVIVSTAKINGEKQPTAYVPVKMGDGALNVFSITLIESPVIGLRDELIANHVMVIAALSLLVLAVGYTVTRAISRRILRLRDGAVEIGNGNLSFRIEEDTLDEMGTLAREFNRMSDRLDEKNTQLEEANRDLERRVSERTEELQQANVQLLEAQSQLVRTEKFGALGELSAGVAHDLRNPLGAIRNGIFFLKSRMAKTDQLAAEPKMAEYLQIMDDRITQCDKIIEDLISFTRISSPDYMLVCLSDVMDSTLAGIDVPEGITVIKEYKEYDDGLLEIHVDPDQLQRVFTNLIVNAYEAMLDGGELIIGASAMGEFTEVTLRDTGPGISAEGLEKIFEPLYTTKIQGTGLGLAVCQQVLAKHNGRMEVHNKEGVGTTFTVTLPRSAEAAQC